MKRLLILSALALLLSGCVIIKEVPPGSTVNVSIWKAQSGVSGDAGIQATTTPRTDLSIPFAP